MHREFRLDRIVGPTILPCALTRNFALAQRAIDPSALIFELGAVRKRSPPDSEGGQTIVGGAGQ